MPKSLNKYSGQITQPETQGSSQAMLYATGMSEDDMQKPQVGIASMWFEGNPCNMHLLDLAAEVKKGVQAAGLVGMRFNTIGVSDGISMGTDGMSYSLQSRDLIADSIETVMCAQWYDACIVLPGCDKNMPGSLIALGRLNRPGFMVYGGTIRAGTSAERRADRHRFGVHLLRRAAAGQDDRRAAARSGAPRLPGRWRVRRHVHRQHDGHGDRSDGHGAAVQLVAAGDRSGQDGRMPPRGRRDSPLHGEGHQAARRDDARGIRERDGDHHGGRRLDERRDAPHRDGPRRGRAAHDRRLPAHERPRAVSGRPAAQRQVRARRFAPSRRHAGRDEACCWTKD